MRKTVITAVVACLLGAATVGAVGTAATSKKGSKTRQAQTTPAATTPSGPPPTLKEMRDKMQAARDAQLEKVADDLGVSLDDLKAALQGVRDDEIDAAVKDNRLTQAEADAIKACAKAPLTCDRSNLPAFGFRGGHPGMRLGKNRDDSYAAIAKKLGKDTADVKKAFESNRPARPAGPMGGGHGPRGHRPGGPGMGGPGMGGPGMGDPGAGAGMGGPGAGGPGF